MVISVFTIVSVFAREVHNQFHILNFRRLNQTN